MIVNVLIFSIILERGGVHNLQKLNDGDVYFGLQSNKMNVFATPQHRGSGLHKYDDI